MKIGCEKMQAADFRQRFQEFKIEPSGSNRLPPCPLTDISLKDLKKTQTGTVKIPSAKCLLGSLFCQALLMTSKESKLYE